VWEAEGRFLPRWELGLGCDAGGGCEVWGWGRGGGRVPRVGSSLDFLVPRGIVRGGGGWRVGETLR